MDLISAKSAKLSNHHQETVVAVSQWNAVENIQLGKVNTMFTINIMTTQTPDDLKWPYRMTFILDFHSNKMKSDNVVLTESTPHRNWNVAQMELFQPPDHANF